MTAPLTSLKRCAAIVDSYPAHLRVYSSANTEGHMGKTTEDARIYRDATISRQTRIDLEKLLRHLEEHQFLGAWQNAVVDVIDRWDANDATEVRIP